MGRVTAVVDVAGVAGVIARCLAFGAVVGVVVVEPMHGKTFSQQRLQTGTRCARGCVQRMAAV